MGHKKCVGKRRVMLLAVAALGAAAVPRVARACSLCGCGDPLVDVSDSVPHAARFRLALDFEYLTASAASDGDPTATESITQETLRPVVVYSPTERFNLVLQVPLVRKAWELSGASPESATNVGLGDVDLGARWFFYEHRDFGAMSRQALGISAGISMPTGANDATDDTGMRIDDHAQLGTGSWGPYVGLVYGYHRDPWNLFASVTVRGHTTSSYGYQYGTSLQWSARVDYRITDGFAVEAGLDGRYAAQDTAMGDVQTNTGGLVLSAAPGLSVRVGGDIWLRARIQVPFVTSLDGDQGLGVTAFASVQAIIP
jgi:hypothetical protein